MGEGGTEGGGEDTTEGVEEAALLVLVLIFLARFVLAFSSSSEEGYEPESCLTCLCSVFAVLRSCLASCAKAPYDGARLKPEVGGKSLGGGGGPEHDESERLTRWRRGSERGMPPLLLLNKEPEEMVEAERCKRRGAEEDRDEMLFRVEELGVEGLMRGGTSAG